MSDIEYPAFVVAYLVTIRGKGQRKIYATIPEEDGSVPSPEPGFEIISVQPLTYL